MNADTDALRKKFMDDVRFSSTLMGTLQRSKTYKDGVTDENKDEFKAALRKLLVKLSKEYGQTVSESQHIKNIEYLTTEISRRRRHVLKDGRFRIGSAQKALNLHLKYLWCEGQIQTPPHCPFDSVIISKLKNYNGPPWTRMDKIAEYEQLVKVASEEAKPDPLAVWELKKWNEFSEE